MGDMEYAAAVQAAMSAKRLSQHNQTKSRKFIIASMPRPLAAIRRRRAEKAEKARRDMGTSNGDLLSFETPVPKKLTRRQKLRELARNRATPVGRWSGKGAGKHGETNSMSHPPQAEQRVSTQKISPSAQSQMDFWSNVHDTAGDSTSTTTVSACSTGIPTVPPLATHSLACLDPFGGPFAEIANRENKTENKKDTQLDNDMLWTMVTPPKAEHKATQLGTTWLDLTLEMSPQKPKPPAAENDSISQIHVPQNPFDMFEMVPAGGSGRYASAVC